MQAVAGSLYGNTYQMTGLNTAEKHLSPLIHQVWQIQRKTSTAPNFFIDSVLIYLFIFCSFQALCSRKSSRA